MSSFPLFRLPLVPTRSTLDMMDLSDRIQLSMSNRKIHQFVKAAGRPLSIESFSDEERRYMSVLDKINLILLEIHTNSDEFFRKYRTSCEVDVSDNLHYYFQVIGTKLVKTWIHFFIYVDPKHRQKRCEGTQEVLKIGDANLPVVMDDNNQMMHTFWYNEIKGIQIIGEWFKQMFQSQIGILIHKGTRKNYSENLRFIVNWMNSTYQENVQNCYVLNYDSDEDLKFVLDNVHPTLSFHLTDTRNPQFHHNPHIKTKHLDLGSAYWFTLENLLMAECETIWFYDSRLTDEDFIEYLKQWLTGEFPVLRHLDMKTREEFDFAHIINELTFGQVTVNGRLEKYTLIREDESISLKRHDGMVARILTPAGNVNKFDMKVSTSSIVTN